MLFLAGHGDRDPRGQFHFLPVDVSIQNLEATCIAGNLIKNKLANLPGRVVVMLDACHSGAAHKGSLADDLLRDLWRIMYEAGVDVVLAAHDHTYERFGPQDWQGRTDKERGIRSFVVGTGGKGLARFGRTRPNSELQRNSAVGFLTMVLKADSYSWKFAPLPTLTLDDSGTGTCHD